MISNTVTVSVQRGADEVFAGITALKVDPDTGHLSLFRDENQLCAMFQRMTWTHFVIGPDEVEGRNRDS